MKNIKSTLLKLDRPPAAQNWVRYNHSDLVKTANAIASFALRFPTISFQSGIKFAKDRIEFGIDLETAVKAVKRSGNPAGWPHNEDFVRAFFKYDQLRNYSGCKSFDGFRGYYRISRDISVPVTPTSVILEKGQLVPIFICGWATNPLTNFQRRLLMTIYEDAVFSLTDFQESPAEILFFPKDSALQRRPEVWKRGDYALLSEAELQEQLNIFLDGRELAKSIIEEKLSKLPSEKDERSEDTDKGVDPDQGSLFD